MADVKWIKIYTDMISNKKIKRIRKLPEGNNIVLIWVFLLAQAGECNKSGALYLTDTIAFRPEDLAIEFDFEVSVINFALITLEKFSMIEVFDEIIYIKNWDEYQNIEGMEKIREQTRLRNVKYREKRKQLALNDVSVTSHDGTELELDLEKEKDTLSCKSDFEKVSKAYAEIHKVMELPYSNSPLLSSMLEEGIPPEHIIGVIREKHRAGISTLKFYEGAIRDSWFIPNHGPKLVPPPKKTGIPDMAETQAHLEEMKRLQEAKRKRIAERATS